MNIVVTCLNGSKYWREKVAFSAEQASHVLSDPKFLDQVRAVPFFDFTADTPAQIADRIVAASDVQISVSFYWNPFGKAIAKESENLVSFNRCKERYGAGSPGNVAHEVMHRMGWSHNGNSPAGNQGTVPWLIGGMVEKAVRGIA